MVSVTVFKFDTFLVNYITLLFCQNKIFHCHFIVIVNTCGSRPGFLIKGRTTADLQEEWKTLVDKQRLIIIIIK